MCLFTHAAQPDVTAVFVASSLATDQDRRSPINPLRESAAHHSLINTDFNSV
ncbi:hypothetical protein D3C84_424890 [compost metagenome]